MKVSPSAKYQLIYEMTNQPENALSVSKLCEIACLDKGNTAQSALMALCKRKATSKSADRIEISRISFARLH